MLVVFEGPSRSGKTTLINEFLKQTQLPVWTRPASLEEFKEKTESWDLFVADELSLMDKVDWSLVNLVVDRHPLISELVYSAVYGRDSGSYLSDPGMLGQQLQWPMFLVYLRPLPHVIIARGNKDGSAKDRELIEREIEEYDFWINIIRETSKTIIYQVDVRSKYDDFLSEAAAIITKLRESKEALGVY